MSLETKKYVRKPAYVEAVEVTDANMEQVAAWCGGEIKVIGTGDEDVAVPYIYISAHKAIPKRLTQAFIGDWVVKTRGRFVVYTAKAFKNNFSDTSQEGSNVRKITDVDVVALSLDLEPNAFGEGIYSVEGRPIPAAPTKRQIEENSDASL